MKNSCWQDKTTRTHRTHTPCHQQRDIPAHQYRSDSRFLWPQFIKLPTNWTDIWSQKHLQQLLCCGISFWPLCDWVVSAGGVVTCSSGTSSTSIPDTLLYSSIWCLGILLLTTYSSGNVSSDTILRTLSDECMCDASFSPCPRHVQPAFHDLSYLRAKIEIVRAQSDIRTGILSRLEHEYQGVLNNINNLETTHPPAPPPFLSSHLASTPLQDLIPAPPPGAAIVFMNDSPAWFQRRYSSMILNILANTPPSWLAQIFHYNSSQFHKGLELNPGLRCLLAKGEAQSRVRLMPIPKYVKRKHNNKHMIFLLWIWEHMPSEMVFSWEGIMFSVPIVPTPWTTSL